ncbi:MAG: hypothetical protein ACRDYB_16825, partial [Acidimicrobiales bacterium]
AALLAAQAAGYAAEAGAAVEAVLGRAERFEPRPLHADRVAERRAWFDRVRRAPTLHRFRPTGGDSTGETGAPAGT